MIKTLRQTRRFVPRYLEKSTPGWIGHLPFAYWLVSEHRPRTVVELGTHYGNSYLTMCQAVADGDLDASCFAVDCWEGDVQAGSYGQEVYDSVHRHNAAHYANFSTLLRMNFDEAVEKFENASIDLLHIDGLHTYEAVKHDFETWHPKLSDRAIILFHDTAVQREGFGVARFWDELKLIHSSHMEFIHNFGLGVLWSSSKLQPRPPYWLRRGTIAQILVKRIFRNRGIKLAVEYKASRNV